LSCEIKRRWIYILNTKIKNYSKGLVRLITIIVVAFILISAIVLLNYKPAYKVIISGEELGYVTNKNEFEKLVNNEILNPNKENVAFVDIEEMPNYEFLLLKKSEETSENEVFAKIAQKAVTTYRVYAITLDNEVSLYVNSREEAENSIAKIKEDKKEVLDEIEIGMQEIYTKDLNELTSTIQLASTTENNQNELSKVIEEKIKIKSSTFNGVYFSVKPVSGVITSRFGATESIRDHSHKGIDISAPNGTAIKAAADGKVTYSGWMGGYGNLVIITHENNVQTYYAHCSKLYVSVGEEVEAGDTIAAVGSTGFSTGNHLHFEIRQNGAQINPQRYLYK